MKFRSKLLMFAIINLCMATAMGTTADLLVSGLSAHTLLMIAVGFAAGMLLSFLIPFPRISAFFCSLFHARPESIPGRLVGTLVPAIINTALIGALMTAINVPPFRVGFLAYLQAYGSVIWILIPVSYLVALFANPLSVCAGNYAENHFRSRKNDSPKER